MIENDYLISFHQLNKASKFIPISLRIRLCKHNLPLNKKTYLNPLIVNNNSNLSDIGMPCIDSK